MSFNKSPQKLVKGWSIDGPNYVIPASCLPQLNKASADPDKGDSRAIVYAFIEAFYQWFKSTPDENKPSKLQISRASYVDDSTDTITKSYTIVISTSPASLDVTPETV